ncbi:MAG: hypothetical protein EA406_14180 [Rhodospirillales bacterium]|nr:MAG: hypothetical protein EA406_14180 [Rhodospirillales bacterium]
MRDKLWLDFSAWCRRRRLQALPAHPWTVAAYARWCEARLHYGGILRAVRAIARAHVLAGHRTPDRDPTVTRTLRLIEERDGTRAGRSALFRDHDFAPRDAHKRDMAKTSHRGGPASAPKTAKRRTRVGATSPPLVRHRPRP